MMIQEIITVMTLHLTMLDYATTAINVQEHTLLTNLGAYIQGNCNSHANTCDSAGQEIIVAWQSLGFRYPLWFAVPFLPLDPSAVYLAHNYTHSMLPWSFVYKPSSVVLLLQMCSYPYTWYIFLLTPFTMTTSAFAHFFGYLVLEHIYACLYLSRLMSIKGVP